MTFFTTRKIVNITLFAVPVFALLSVIANFLFKTGPIVIQFGYPFPFYIRYGGYMSGQTSFNTSNLLLDFFCAWMVVAVFTYLFQLKSKTKQ